MTTAKQCDGHWQQLLAYSTQHIASLHAYNVRMLYAVFVQLATMGRRTMGRPTQTATAGAELYYTRAVA